MYNDNLYTYKIATVVPTGQLEPKFEVKWNLFHLIYPSVLMQHMDRHTFYTI